MAPENRVPLPRHEVWRLHYRREPYLRDASDSGLSKRLEDIVNNMTTLTQAGKLGVLSPDTGGERWMILFTHVLEEYESRGGIPKSALSIANLPRPMAPRAPKFVEALKGLQAVESVEILVKLGKREHMWEMFSSGRVRIASARSYSDPSLNHAMQDDELRIDLLQRGSEVRLQLLDESTGKPKQNIRPIGEATHSFDLKSNYYVYCMTHFLSYRLFDDFDADSCVIIRDPKEFRTRLVQAVQRQLTSWVGWDQSVEYIDPYFHNNTDIDLCFSKHFRFWYQQEYRFCWLPQGRSCTSLEPFFVELGSLEQIAEFVAL